MQGDMKKEIIIFHESTLNSILKDTYTFGVLISLLVFNHFVLEGNNVVYFFIGLIWLVWIIGKAAKTKKNIFTSQEKAIKYIKNL